MQKSTDSRFHDGNIGLNLVTLNFPLLRLRFLRLLSGAMTWHKTVTIYKNLFSAILDLAFLRSWESLENIGRGVNNTAEMKLKN